MDYGPVKPLKIRSGGGDMLIIVTWHASTVTYKDNIGSLPPLRSSQCNKCSAVVPCCNAVLTDVCEK